MIGRKAVIGLALLCALVFGAISAQSAFAKGTTGSTCIPEAGKGSFSDAHCGLLQTNGGFKSLDTEEKKETLFEGSNAATASETKAAAPAVLKATVGGIATEVECTTSSSAGAFKNEKSGVGQMYAEAQTAGKLTVITYTGCAVRTPIGMEEECLVHSVGKAAGTIVTNQLLGITAVEKVGAEEVMYVLLISTGAGEKFLELVFEVSPGKKCPAALTANPLPLTGEAKLDANGATMISPNPNKNAASSLKLGGNAATLTSSETMRMDKEGGAQQNPLFLRTTET